MKTSTDAITIGRDPSLTLSVLTAIARRQEASARRAALIRKLKFWKRTP